MTVDEVLEEIRKDLPFYRASGGGVTFSGGEPFAQPDFLEELCCRCQEEGIADPTEHIKPYSEEEKEMLRKILQEEEEKIKIIHINSYNIH